MTATNDLKNVKKNITENGKAKKDNLKFKNAQIQVIIPMLISVMLFSLTAIKSLDVELIKLSITVTMLFLASLITKYAFNFGCDKLINMLGILAFIITIITLWG